MLRLTCNNMVMYSDHLWSAQSDMRLPLLLPTFLSIFHCPSNLGLGYNGKFHFPFYQDIIPFN